MFVKSADLQTAPPQKKTHPTPSAREYVLYLFSVPTSSS